MSPSSLRPEGLALVALLRVAGRALAIVTLAASCHSSTLLAPGVSDSTFVSALAALHNVAVDTAKDSASKVQAREEIIPSAQGDDPSARGGRSLAGEEPATCGRPLGRGRPEDRIDAVRNFRRFRGSMNDYWRQPELPPIAVNFCIIIDRPSRSSS